MPASLFRVSGALETTISQNFLFFSLGAGNLTAETGFTATVSATKLLRQLDALRKVNGMRGLHAVCRFCSQTVRGVPFHDRYFSASSTVLPKACASKILWRISGDGCELRDIQTIGE
jgi:hypothetical protein